jgi:nucleoside-diphosphate-sugar epimerase
MQALVTGGGGFLGQYIVEQLLAQGNQVRVYCRGNYPELTRLGVEVVQGDLRDEAKVRGACQGCEAVFHVAAVPGVWGPWKKYYETNTLGTENILRGCQTAGVHKLIYTSSPSVVFDGHSHLNADESLPYPKSYLCHYPHSKALAEQAVLAANGPNFSTCALRPHLIWGPRDNHLIPRLLERAKTGRLRRIGNGQNEISMSYVENAAVAHLQAANALSPTSPVAGQAYFINEPQPVKLWDWVDEILALVDLPPVKKSISATTAYAVGTMLEGAYSVFKLSGEPIMTRFVALQMSQSHSYSVEKAQRDFGYAPAISKEEGMRRLQEWIATTHLHAKKHP